MTTISTPVDAQGKQIPCTVIRSAKRKRSIGMTITKEGVVVRAPTRCSDRMIQQFFDAKAIRIQRKRAAQTARQELSTLVFDDNGLPLAFHHFGKQVPIYLKTHDKKRANIIQGGGDAVTAVLPEEWSSDFQTYTEQLITALERWQRRSAVEYLTQRTKVLNDELGLNVGEIIVRSYKRKYGQCRGRDISLDRKLIRFPIAISDHVIYHELAHLTHKHHQKSFRDLLEEYDPETKKHKLWLKNNGPAMHSDW